ncbi:MAG: hypothetical protein MJZ38_07940, partial [archaeon]|nr:hypothetical protein [archaeon]
EASALLKKMWEVYGDSGSICATLVDHALCNGFPVPDHRIYTDRLTVNVWIDSLVNRTNTVPLDMETLNLMRSGYSNVRFIGGDIPLVPLERAYRQIFRQISSKKDLLGALGVEEVIAKRSIYVGLEYLRNAKSTTVRVNNYLGSRKFLGFIDKSVSFATELCKSHKENTVMKKSPFTFCGVNCANILIEEYMIWWATQDRPAEIKLELDEKAVSTAVSDLEEVTRLMKVDGIDEEPEEEGEQIKEEPAPAQSNPWSEFFASLGENERTYLATCMKGRNTTSLLKQIGTTKVRMEDGINSRALDTVGDTVVEDGTIVEDYLDEMEKGL